MEIKLNSTISLDLPKLIESRLLVQANSGGGKSWLIRRILEQSHGKVQHIVLDPEGEFSTLREKYDYILAGKGGDTPAEPRSAALLARKLLELNVSAIIDLYELQPQERKRFVRLFLDAMVNAPKDLYHDCIVVLDEAHVFAPQSGESEASSAVIDMATRGRKRGFCLIPATQRISKLHKDVAAECNNKLIGRSALDVDMKRSGDELGFTTKEQLLSLRTMKPGEFYAFGPAISDEIQKIKVGEIRTSHPKVGSRSFAGVVPPTAGIKKILGKLADLPKEAEQEARTSTELRAEVARLNRELTLAKKNEAPRPPATKIERIQVPVIGKRSIESLKKMEVSMRKTLKSMKDQNDISKSFASIFESSMVAFSKELDRIGNLTREAPHPIFHIDMKKVERALKPPESLKKFSENTARDAGFQFLPKKDAPEGSLPVGEKKVLTAIAQYPEGASREQLTILTGYKRSSRDTYLQRLRERGFTAPYGDTIIATPEGVAALGREFERLPTGSALREHWMARLPEGERKVLQVLVEAYPEAVERDRISEATGYQRSSRDTYLQRLGARRLVVNEGRGMVQASKELFDSTP